jgi:hypothetical protein
MLIAAILAAVAVPSASAQQGPALPAARLGAPVDPGVTAVPLEVSAAWPPADYKLPPVAEPSIPSSPPDPLLDQPELPPPGWFANAELSLIAPHVYNRLLGVVTVTDSRADSVHVPPAALNNAASPRFEGGYRLPDGFGEFLLSYRFLVTQGAGSLGSDAGPLHLESRLDVNVFNFDFANTDPLWWGWEMRWRVGVQLATAFFDARSNLLAAPETPVGTPTEQHASNQLVGTGPHAGLELWRRLALPGLSVYGAVEGSSLYCHLHQEFEEQLLPGPGVLAAPAGRTIYTTSQGVGVLGLRLGLSWSPPGNSAARFFLGYQFEQWWQVGRNDNNGSLGNLTEQGIFLRGEFTF